MVTFAGVSHVAFTVTDVDVSLRLYTEVLDFVAVMDIGYGRVCMHPQTGFTLALVKRRVRAVVTSPSWSLVSTTWASPRRRGLTLRSGSVASTSTA